MKPSDMDTTRAQRLEQWHNQLAQVRALVAEHTALAHQLQDLHDRFCALQTLGLSLDERRAQIDDIVRAEAGVLEQARAIQQQLQRLLDERHHLLS